MIIQDVYLSDYNWRIKVFYAVSSYYTEEILKELIHYNPTVKEYNEVSNVTYNFEYNTGFTFTDYSNKKSMVIIGLTTSPDEFLHTFDHEKGHLATHIALYYNISPYGETFLYLTGDIGKELFPIAKKFLCEHCRHSLMSDLSSSKFRN